LLVDAGTRRVNGLRTALESRSATLEHVPDLDEARRAIALGDFDLAFIADGGDAANVRSLMGDLGKLAPDLPVAILPQTVGSVPDVALVRSQSLAYVVVGDANGVRLACTIRDRTRAQSLWDDDSARPSTTADDGSGDSALGAMCGPSPTPVTGRSLGAESLAGAYPEAFAEAVAEYTELLQDAVGVNTIGDREEAYERINRLVNRLGTLNAGPRDVVDIHKAVIAERIRGHAPRRVKALIEEGRLFTLRVMGYLVSFYRNMSWGNSPRNMSDSGQGPKSNTPHTGRIMGTANTTGANPPQVSRKLDQ